MLDLYVVRHGKTLFNEKDLVQGICDSQLVESGIESAKWVGKNTMDIPFVKAYTSPSLRAWDTCLYVLNGRDVEVVLDRRLLEMSFGSLEGEKNKMLFKHRPKDHFQAIAKGFVDVGGENEAMVTKRIASFIDDLIKNDDGKCILLTSHGVYISILLSYLLNNRTINYFMTNCGVTHLRYDGSWHLIDFNNKTYSKKRDD